MFINVFKVYKQKVKMIYKEVNGLKVDNFNEDYFKLHEHILNNGSLVESRNGDTRELLDFKTIVEDPTKRCIGGNKRNINIFFLLAEAMWIWTGRRDVAFLDIFNSKMKNYSDDGKYFNAPYGWRLRNQGIDSMVEITEENKHSFDGMDQIKIALNLLNKNPEDRRVVCSIWNPEFDLGRNGKDFPCVSGNSRFLSPEGNLTIKQVYNYLKSGELERYPIYSYDEKNDLVVLKMLDKVVYSGKKKVIKITLQNGGVIKITPDHRMYKRNNLNKKDVVEKISIIEAQYLKVGDILLSDVISKNVKGYFTHKKKLFVHTSGVNICTIHKQYYEYICGDVEDFFDIHHIDRDKENNSILNLEAINRREHAQEHKKDKEGDLNPTNRESDAKRRLRLFRRRFSLRKIGYTVPHHPDDEIYNELVDIVNREDKKILKKNKKIIKENVAKIISIEECEVEDVYDFHVPGLNNALFENGIVVHNCNDLLMFKIRNGKLFQTIQNRSNDLNWGLTTNIFQFSFIGEIMSKILNVKLGSQVHNSQSLHIYLKEPLTNSIKCEMGKQRSNIGLYDFVEPMKMDFIGIESLSIDETLGKIDFIIKSIITILMSQNNKNSEEKDWMEFENELQTTSKYFTVISKLLKIYIEYKRKERTRLECVTLIYLLGDLNDCLDTDIFALALNFFVIRIMEGKDDEEKEALNACLKVYSSNNKKHNFDYYYKLGTL